MKLKPLLYLFLIIAVIVVALDSFYKEEKPSPFDIDEAQLSTEQLLGKKLFEDKNLSEPRGVSCASCHEPQKAFQGNNGSRIAAIAKGSRDEHFGTRNVPAITYAFLSPAFHFASEKDEEGKEEVKAVGGQFLDGRAASLIEQIEFPLLSEKEMNNASKDMVVEKVKSSSYAGLVKKLYGEDIFADTDKAFTSIATAIAAFEMTPAFARFSSKFDRVLEGKAQFTAIEAKGFELFKDPQKGNCLACHVGTTESKNPRDWSFTDFTYDNLGVPRNMAIPENKNSNYYDLGLCDHRDIEKKAPKDFAISSLCGAFKVPTLRNVATTAPYMHNGFFKDLRDVVKFYATRDTNPELWYSKKEDGTVDKYDDLPLQYHNNVNVEEVPYDKKIGEKPRLNDEEIDALVAFLKTLSDE